MPMQRKHYNAIAAALRSGGASADEIKAVAEALYSYSLTFQPAKFIEKATVGLSMEQRTKRYLTQVKRIERYHQSL